MTWGPYVTLEPQLSPEEQERREEERRARKLLRRAGWVLAIAFAFAGLKSCATMGERVEACPAPRVDTAARSTELPGAP